MLKKLFLTSVFILSVVLVGCSFPPEPGTDEAVSEQAGPGVEQMKVDLLGHRLVVGGQSVWEFAALSEFEQFDIRGEKTEGNVIEYDVSMRLKDFPSNTHYLADAFIVYKSVDGQWELISIGAKVFERINGATTY